MDHPTERLNQGLAEWERWALDTPLNHAPSLGDLLAEGSGHAIYEILDQQHKPLPLVARIRLRATRSGSEALGQELAAWQSASENGLAPQVVYTDHIALVICRRMEPAMKPVAAATLGALCRDIHALPVTLPRLSLHTEIDTYLQALPLAQQREWQRAMHERHVGEALTLLERDPPAFCHNDLTEGNLMSDGDRLVAIDWEYAAMGSRYFDIAIAAGSRTLPERRKMYQAALPDHVDERLLKAGLCVASLVTALWQAQFAVTEAPSPTDWQKQVVTP
jgi:thiamine kinase